MHLHRAFYLRALLDDPEDPFKSPYHLSVHAVLRGARETMIWLQAIVLQAPALCARLPTHWNLALQVAVRLMVVAVALPRIIAYR